MIIIFDVDGTLIGGETYDWECFRDAFYKVTERRFTESFWQSIEEVTAPAIIHQALSDLPLNDRNQIESLVKAEFTRLLRGSRKSTPDAFAMPEKTRQLLEYLQDSDRFDLAIATGDWYESITLKLQAAGFDLRAYTYATGSDALKRADIIRKAADRASRPLEDAIYVGDGLWDLRACRTLDIPFIGTGERVHQLREAGSDWTLEELELESFLEIVEQIEEAPKKWS